MPSTIHLKPGKDKPMLGRHPWIFSGAIERVENASDGDTVDVLSSSGQWLARGYYNSRSQITVRVWTWRKDEQVDREFLRTRLERALDLRRHLVTADSDGVRLVNAESDHLPGLVVDRYADYLVVQFLTLGIERRKEEIISLLAEMLNPKGIYERSDVDVREKEGLASQVGLQWGEEPPARVEFREHSFRFLADVKRGHKTGFYLDQRDNRARMASLLAGLGPGRLEVLNVFSYTGAFSVYAAQAQPAAHIVNLDASADALALARENMRLNGCEDQGEFVEGDAFHALRRYRDQARTFDVIILDPPKFVYSQAQLQTGCRGYKDINLLAIKMTKPGGLLVTFSCSGLVDSLLFQKVIHGAAADAGRDLQVVARLSHAADHPVLLSFPESEYLKGLVCRVV